jgi:hypothetical protein
LSRHETVIVDFSKVCAWVCLATANPGQCDGQYIPRERAQIYRANARM